MWSTRFAPVRRAHADTISADSYLHSRVAKVTRLALQNAASDAGLLLTTEVLIAEAPKDEEDSHGSPGGDMGSMDGMDM